MAGASPSLSGSAEHVSERRLATSAGDRTPLEIDLRLHRGGKGRALGDLVEKSREPRPARAPFPHLMSPRGVFERRAKHDLRRVYRSIWRPLVMPLPQRPLERVGDAVGALLLQRDFPGRALTKAQLPIPYADAVEEGDRAAGIGQRSPAVGAVHREQRSATMLGIEI